MDDRETVEHVPWSDFDRSGATDDRSRLYAMAAVAGAALLIGVVVGRVLAGGGGPGPVAVETPPSTVASTETVLATTTTLPLYSEAELFADDVASPERAAAARAEWFVADFFTADLDPAGGAEVRAALPSGADLPERSEEAAGSVAYVEWARALRVEPVGTDTYRVDVAFRAVGAPPDRGFQRLPVKAVEVLIAVSPDGGTTVMDLPAPIDLPAGPEPIPWPENEAEAPSEVVAAAVAQSAVWGSEPRLLASQSTADGWRIVMTVADAIGNRWPFAVRVDSTGRRLG